MQAKWQMIDLPSSSTNGRANQLVKMIKYFYEGYDAQFRIC